MSRVTLALVALAGILAGALGYATLVHPAPQTDSVAVQAMIDDAISAYDSQRRAPAPQAVAAIAPETINPLIESYLMSDPKILQRMSVALDSTLRAEEREQSTAAIASMQESIFNDPGQVVVGNPDGDVTLVEFFDYNCGYCRAALPDMAKLLAEDPNLRVILKEFPILAAAADLGLNPVTLELDMGTPAVSGTIQTSYEIAKALNITGTPTYIIGNEVIPGAIGIDELRSRISNMRACGQSQCDS